MAALRPRVHRLVVEAHALAQHRGPGRLLRDDQLPAGARVGRAVDPEPAVAGDAVLGAVLGDHERGVRIRRVEREAEAEGGRQTVPVEPLPARAAVVGAVDAAMVLLPEPVALRRMGEQLVDALADLRIAVVREEARLRTRVQRPPASAGVVGSEDACSRDADPQPLRIVGVERDRMRDQAAGTRRPPVARLVPQDGVVHLPRCAGVVGAEEDRGLAAEPERAGLGRMPRLEVPRRGELEAALLGQPEPLRALPRLAHVGGALHGAAVDPVVRARIQRPVARIDGRVVDRPAGEVRPVDLEGAPLVVSADEEEPLARPHEQHHAHRPSLTNRTEITSCT